MTATIPTPLSLSTRELEIIIAAASEMRSPADRVRLLEGVADQLMACPKNRSSRTVLKCFA